MTEPISETIQLLAQRVESLQDSAVSRREFDELKGLVHELMARVDRIVPNNDVPDEHLAIMSAAFAASIGKRFRIRSIKTLTESSGWAQAGRVNLHAQRHVRRS